jgi:DNA-binding helix-hairpin-helix protein with protein kinase domain
MTTKHLSLHRASAANTITLINSLCQPIQLGNEVGKGGEGRVYEVTGYPSLVAKLYHQTPLASDHVAKLEAMVACGTPELEAISAWPHSVLYDPQRRLPRGILMPRIAESRHLHELYGTYNRRRHFPDVRWHHLLLAARNVAAAFDTMHAARIVVGDVNQGNLMVDAQMCVRFIDCDSFQIQSNGRIFHCPVGTPHFTPPELQSTKLRDVTRTPDHDRFGMAILIFHLLFVGRHPFAGRFRRPQELTIERAIAERRFAFSANKTATLVDPPPASLLLSDLPEPLAELFELAFRDRGEGLGRPTASRWCERLEAVLRQRKACTFDPCHVFYDRLTQCPWCRIEDEGGPAFFVAGGATSIISQDRLEVFDRKIRELQLPSFPDLAPRRLAIPTALSLKSPDSKPKVSRGDVAAIVMAVSVILCLLSPTSWHLLLSGMIGLLAGGSVLLFSQQAKHRRKQVTELNHRLVHVQGRLIQLAQAITAGHRKLKLEFDNAVDEFNVECEHYRADKTNLADVLVFQRVGQKNHFLAQHSIQDGFASTYRLSTSMVSMLQSFGVDSALDVNKLNLSAIPMMSPSLKMELLRWRDEVEATFVYRPEHGVTLNDAKTADEVAVRRFKASQARKVLMGAKQLQAMVDVARYELQRALAEFDDLASRGRDIAVKLCDFQSGRRPLERWLNDSMATILAPVIGAPLVGCALYWMFG